MPGDTVAHRGAQVLVNGRVVGRMKPLTRFGEPLAAGPTGTIPHGCYYVGTPHKDGFDSRYAAIGYACAKKIVGVGEAIL
jgi:conjugal transfer pilin signal peptidase TrbI